MKLVYDKIRDIPIYPSIFSIPIHGYEAHIIDLGTNDSQDSIN
jgi:hypothetical protein